MQREKSLLLLSIVVFKLCESGYTFNSGHSPPVGYTWDDCYWSTKWNEWRFQCDNGMEILCDLVCDYLAKCENGEDEENCPVCDGDGYGYACELSSECISESWLCDGITDCPLKSDENPAFCAEYRLSKTPTISATDSALGSTVPPTWENTKSSREGHDSSVIISTSLPTHVPTMQPHFTSTDPPVYPDTLFPTLTPIQSQSPKETQDRTADKSWTHVGVGDTIYLSIAGILFLMIIVLMCCVCAIISKTGTYRAMLESMQSNSSEKDEMDANVQQSTQNPLSVVPAEVLDDSLIPPVMFFNRNGFVRKGTPQQSRQFMESFNLLDSNQVRNNDNDEEEKEHMVHPKRPKLPPTILNDVEYPVERDDASLSPPHGWPEWYTSHSSRPGLVQSGSSNSTTAGQARSIVRRPYHPTDYRNSHNYLERRHSIEEKAYCLSPDDSSTDTDDDFKPVMSADPGEVSRMHDTKTKKDSRYDRRFHGQRTVLGVDTSSHDGTNDNIWNDRTVDQPQGLFGLRLPNKDEQFLEANW